MVFLNPYAFVTGKAVLHFSAIVYHGHAQVHQPYDGKVFLNIKHPHKLRFAGNHISAPQSVQSTRHVLIGFQASRIVWTGQFFVKIRHKVVVRHYKFKPVVRDCRNGYRTVTDCQANMVGIAFSCHTPFEHRLPVPIIGRQPEYVV